MHAYALQWACVCMHVHGCSYKWVNVEYLHMYNTDVCEGGKGLYSPYLIQHSDEGQGVWDHLLGVSLLDHAPQFCLALVLKPAGDGEGSRREVRHPQSQGSARKDEGNSYPRDTKHLPPSL